MSREIMNMDQVCSYVSSLIGKFRHRRYFLEAREEDKKLSKPSYAYDHKEDIEKELVRITLFDLLEKHLKEGAKGTAVPLYGLRYLDERDKEFKNLPFEKRQIVKEFSRSRYASRYFPDPVVPPCRYNFFFLFEPQRVSPKNREKLKQAVAYLKEQACAYVAEQFDKVRVRRGLFELLPDYSAPLEFKGKTNIQMRYFLSKFSSLNDLMEAVNDWERQSRKEKSSLTPKAPTSLGKQPEAEKKSTDPENQKGQASPVAQQEVEKRPLRQPWLFQ